jgi:pyridoxine kinase
MKNPVKKVCAVHDLAGLGHVSLNEVISIMTNMGHQVVSLPTAVLSSNTAYKNFRFVDLTDQMQGFVDHWKELDIVFDAIYSGFLGSPKQIDIVKNLINDFANPNLFVVVDPVFGDDGELYSSFDSSMVDAMRELVKSADIITPNLTEAAFLLEENYPEFIDLETAKAWCKRLAEFGPKVVVLTSVPEDILHKRTSVVAYNKEEKRFWKVTCDYIPASYPGTGDAFTSVLLGSLMQGDSLPIALDRAVQFISIGIRSTYGFKHQISEGILLERVLHYLKAPIPMSSFEILDQ